MRLDWTLFRRRLPRQLRKAGRGAVVAATTGILVIGPTVDAWREPSCIPLRSQSGNFIANFPNPPRRFPVAHVETEIGDLELTAFGAKMSNGVLVIAGYSKRFPLPSRGYQQNVKLLDRIREEVRLQVFTAELRAAEDFSDLPLDKIQVHCAEHRVVGFGDFPDDIVPKGAWLNANVQAKDEFALGVPRERIGPDQERTGYVKFLLVFRPKHVKMDEIQLMNISTFQYLRGAPGESSGSSMINLHWSHISRLRWLLALVLVVHVLFGGVPSADGCECSLESQRHAFRRASMVFVGTVLGAGRLDDRTSAETDEGECVRLVRMRVTRRFKGPEVQEVVVEQCGSLGCYPYDLQIGETYLVYAFGKDLRVMTSACTRSRRAGDPMFDAEVRALGSRRWRFTTRMWPWWH